MRPLFLLLACLPLGCVPCPKIAPPVSAPAPVAPRPSPARLGKFSYSLIEEGLYLGGAVPEPPETRAVVNLWGEPDPYEDEASLHEPIYEGGEMPDVEWLRRVVGFIAEQRRLGRVTYVHCQAGAVRSAAVVTACLMAAHGWRRDEALAFIQQHRPLAQPDRLLMRLLAEWETAKDSR